MERENPEAQNNDLSIFEAKIFESHPLGNFQKYLQTPRKTPIIPQTVELNEKQVTTDKERER